ncbi:MAG: hypothetical protein QOF89_544 [Acidobacteriota bacterium]|jgi:WD40 repeat protein|nr:hypothetical protein [Acidobacteriota bacterium]
MAHRYDVFLSHSSADKPAVEKLAQKLLDAGLSPFLDKWHLVPGRLWQLELENGLRDSSACLIFVGTEGFGPWHRQEMLVALDRGARDPDFPIIPVLLPGFKKPTEIPAFLSQRTWVEFPDLNDEEAFHRLVSGIQGKAPGPGFKVSAVASPYRCMAQPPDGFIHRSEYEKVLEALCPKEGTAQASPSVGITTALRGAGGFGKTALAQAICFDERIRRHYPDGILWTTMGDNLNPESRVSRILDLIRWWTNMEPPGFKDIQVAGSKLREILNGQRVLVVVDDVWSPDDVKPFQGLWSSSAVLITTRDSQTLPDEAVRFLVDSMASSEAISLLCSGLPEGSSKEFTSLAARLGEWPLLLKLVNRQLRDLVNQKGLAISKAIVRVEADLDSEGFSTLNLNDSNSRYAAATRTLLVSVRHLPERERALFPQLAVFPEVEIPYSVLEAYWNLSGTQRVCEQFYDLSLLLSLDVVNETIRLHDIVRKILTEQVRAELPSMHARLLDSHRPTGGHWADLAEKNQYLWRNLAGHLLGAGRIAELRDLLVDFSFLEAKLKATDVNALISDYASLAGDDQEFRLIQGAIRLSAHILGRDKRQLSPQLLGRLLNRKEEYVRRLTDKASSWQCEFWLRPRTASLTQPGGALIRVLEGHSAWVNAVAVLPSGRVVSGSDDGTLRVWDLESGRTLQTLEGHTASVHAVAVLDGRSVVSASADRTLRMWDLESGRTLQALEGHAPWTPALAVLDGRQAVSGSTDGTLQVWDLESGRTLQTLEGHTASVRAVVVLDGHRAVSGSADGTLRVWDLESGRTLQTLEGHTDWVHAVAVLDGRSVVSASADRTLRVWDLESGRTLQILKGHTDWVRAVAVLDGRRAVSGSADGTLRVWDWESGRTLQTLEGHTDSVHTVAVLDGRRAVSGSADRTLRVWDLESGRTLQTLEEHTNSIRAVAVLDGRRAISGSDDGTLRVRDLESGRTLQTLEGHTDSVRAVAVFDGRLAVSGSADGTLRMWDPESGRTLQTLEGHTNWVHAVAVLDGRRAVSGSDDRTLRVWDLESGCILQTLKGHTDWVRAVAVLDGRRAVSGSDDRTLRVWDLESGCTLQTLEGHTNSIRAVAVLDGRRTVSASIDRTLRVWDLESGCTLQILEGHTDWINAVVAVDGRRAVSASDDRTLRVWDLESGEALAVMTLDAQPMAVAVSPDGRIVVAGDQAGRVHFFDVVVPE